MMTFFVFVIVWIIRKQTPPAPTEAGKKRQRIMPRILVGEFVFLTLIVLLSVGHLLTPRALGFLGLANFFGLFLIIWIAQRRTPITERDISREQRVRALKGTKTLLVVYGFGLLNGLFRIREFPLPTLLIGVFVSSLILAALIIHIRRQQVKLEEIDRLGAPQI
jgi:hypothetical protein